MFRRLIALHRTKTGTGADEHEKMARLEQAEKELDSLKLRAACAIGILDARQKQNHWRESIEKMIQGAY